MAKMDRLSMKAMKLSAMKSTKKRPSAATNLKEEQRDGAMKEARIVLVRAHQRQLQRDQDRSSFIAAQERTYSEVCADLHRVDLHGSHKIMLYRGIWFCASCGAYTDGQRKHSIRNLCSQCKPGKPGGKMRLRRLALERHPDLKPWPAELNRHRIESASPWPAPFPRIRRRCKTRPELDEIARELVLAGRACPRGVRPASSNAAASSSRQVAVAAYGAAAVAAYKCGQEGRGIQIPVADAVAANSEALRASLNDAAATNSENVSIGRLLLSDIRQADRLYQGKQPLRHPAGGVGVRRPQPDALVAEAAPKLRRSCADENGCGRCFCHTCYQL